MQPIGEFLISRDLKPPYIDIDQLSMDDVKQDACLRSIIALRRAGKPIGPDPIAAFNAEPRLVMTAYKRAKTDALRVLCGGRNTQASARWRRLVSLDNGFTQYADPAQGEAFDAILRDAAAIARLAAFSRDGYLHINAKTARRLIRVLRQTQRLRDEGLTNIPPKLRVQLSVLRRITQLRFDPRLL